MDAAAKETRLLKSTPASADETGPTKRGARFMKGTATITAAMYAPKADVRRGGAVSGLGSAPRYLKTKNEMSTIAAHGAIQYSTKKSQLSENETRSVPPHTASPVAIAPPTRTEDPRLTGTSSARRESPLEYRFGALAAKRFTTSRRSRGTTSPPPKAWANTSTGSPQKPRDIVNRTPITSTQMHATAIPRNAGAKTRRRAVSRARYREKSAAYGAQLSGIEAARIVMNANPAIPPPEGA